MARPNAGCGLSDMLFLALYKMYDDAIRNYSTDDAKLFSNKINVQTIYGIAAFPLAVTVWEAFLYEQTYGAVYINEAVGSVFFASNDLRDVIERSDIKSKTIVLPEILFGKTYSKGTRPFSDFRVLVDIRNHIVHFKNMDYPQSSIRFLERKQMCLIAPKNSEFAWPMQLYSTECIRWSINIISEMIRKFDMIRCGHEDRYHNEIYGEISEEDARNIFLKYSIDCEYVSPRYQS